MKRNVVIFFPNHHLAYSPTTINLYKSLESKFNVKIIAPYPSRFNNKELNHFNVEYFKDPVPSLFMKVMALFLVFFKNVLPLIKKRKRTYTYSIIKALLKYEPIFKKALSQHKNDIIIAVDIIFLKIAVKYFGKANFVSLELMDDLLPLLDSIPESKIESVVIQSEDRFKYLFKKRSPEVFYIQNAVFYNSEIPLSQKMNNTIIFNGTASRFFGVYYFLNFLNSYSNQYSGIIKGNVAKEIEEEININYQLLVKEGKLIIDNTYLETDLLTSYVSAYQIGICFYDMAAINENKFNYLSAPSGKMFTYFASGVPVIASNIPGLKIIEDFGAGVLVDDYAPETIFNAIKIIETDYDKYYHNCLKAAEHFSFEKLAKPFVSFLDQ